MTEHIIYTQIPKSTFQNPECNPDEVFLTNIEKPAKVEEMYRNTKRVGGTAYDKHGTKMVDSSPVFIKLEELKKTYEIALASNICRQIDVYGKLLEQEGYKVEYNDEIFKGKINVFYPVETLFVEEKIKTLYEFITQIVQSSSKTIRGIDRQFYYSAKDILDEYSQTILKSHDNKGDEYKGIIIMRNGNGEIKIGTTEAPYPLSNKGIEDGTIFRAQNISEVKAFFKYLGKDQK